MLPFEVGHFVRVTSSIVNRARRKVVHLNDAIVYGDAMVIFTECRRLVNNSGTVCILHVRVGDDPERPILVLA